MNKFERKHLAALERRRDWLAEKPGGGSSYDKAECAALRWAIDWIEVRARAEALLGVMVADADNEEG